MEDIVSKLKGISAILNHMSDSTDSVQWNGEGLILLNEELVECIEELEQRNQ